MRPTNLPEGVTSQGMLLTGGGVPTTFGTVYFVDYDNGSDGNRGRSMAQAFKTLDKANNSVTTNKNDIILLSANSTHALTEMLTVSKNRVHFIGLDGGGRMYGQRTKVSLGVTTAATDIATIKVTGVGCSFRNIKFMNSNTVDEGIYCVAEGGEFSLYENCEFYKDTDLDQTDAAELLHNGDSAQFRNCTFGSLVNIVADNVIRPCVKLARETITGKVCRDSYFENCLFWRKAGGTETQFVYAAGATDVERMLMFNGCSFINNPLSAATPAHAVGAGAAQTEGVIFLKNCSSVDCTVMVEASVGIYVDGAVPTFATTGVSKAS